MGIVPQPSEVARVRQELKNVGVTGYGMAKFAARHLPSILHEDEHVKGAVYGRYAAGSGLLNWEEGILVATERRIIFVDRKPGYEATDELTYDVVSGVQKSYAWPFAALTLHTRLGNYTIRFANKRCINIFMKYVEKRRLESANRNGHAAVTVPAPLDEKSITFLNEHDTLVLSTVDRGGDAHGAAVHYLINENAIYILTKADTQKVHAILAHHQVALTLYDHATMQTLQMQATAEVEARQIIKDRVFAAMSKPRVYGERMEYPPVTASGSGAFIIIRFTLIAAHLSEFGRR